MFTSISMAGTGLVVTLIETILRLFGFEFAEGSVFAAVNGIVIAVGFVLMIVGQLRRKDLLWGFLRKF